MTVKRQAPDKGDPEPTAAQEQAWLAELQRVERQRAKIDALVRPVIEHRIRSVLPFALEAAKGGPISIYRDTLAPSADEERRRTRQTEIATRTNLIRQLLFPTLKRIIELVPSVTREDLIAYIEASLPAQGRHRPRVPFDPQLVEQAHADILKARPELDCRLACQEIAVRLRISRRQVERIRATRPK